MIIQQSRLKFRFGKLQLVAEFFQLFCRLRFELILRFFLQTGKLRLQFLLLLFQRPLVGSDILQITAAGFLYNIISENLVVSAINGYVACF